LSPADKHFRCLERKASLKAGPQKDPPLISCAGGLRNSVGFTRRTTPARFLGGAAWGRGEPSQVCWKYFVLSTTITPRRTPLLCRRRSRVAQFPR
jgi:hypothetical protein